LAALATVGAAQAQSSVTVYGSFDTSYNDVKLDNVGGLTATAAQVKARGINVATPGALTSNRIGFRGEEDLGGGLRARFNLEYGFFGNLSGDTQTSVPYATTSAGSTAAINENQTVQRADAVAGVGAIQTRTSRVGLSSAKLGSLDVGYGLSGLFGTITGHSPLPGNNWVGDVAYTSNATSGADARILSGAVRFNGVQYTSPTVNGLRAVVDYGAGSTISGSSAATDVRASNAGLTLNYTAGALSLAGTVHQLKGDLATGNNEINTTDFQAISARYSVTSNLAVNALYAKNKTTGQANTQTGKNDVQQVGVRYTMGKNVLALQYGEGEGEAAPGASRRDRKGYQLAAMHNLSKRTNVYALYGSQEAKYVDAASGGTAGTKEKISGYAVGLRHSF